MGVRLRERVERELTRIHAGAVARQLTVLQAVTVGLGVEHELALTLAHALGDALALPVVLSVTAAL